MARFLSRLLGGSLIVGLALSGGCDTLRARSRAQDGVKAYRAGEVALAAEKFEEAQKLDPTIPVVWLNLGFASLAVYQADPKTIAGQNAAVRTIAAFEEYLRLRPEEERAKSYLVQTFVDTGRYEDAVKFFQPAVDHTPPDAQALATLGTIASKIGRFDEAATWYQRRIDAEPTNSDARLALAVLLWDRLKTHVEIIGKPRVDVANRALAALAEARRLSPASPNAFLYTNLVYRERANTNLGEDAKRADLELANAYFRIANGMGKGDAKDAGLDADRKLIADNTVKADAIVNTALEVSDPAAPPRVPGAKK